MIDIQIVLTARDIREKDVSGKVAVVIDVLRATSVILTALANGAAWVKTVATIEEALEQRGPGVLLGGERHALPIKGFDLGNSPVEYTVGRVTGKGIMLTTTNGTLAVAKCTAASEVLPGALLNRTALARYLAKRKIPVVLACAGTNGQFTLDDFLCAGAICSSLQQLCEVSLDDLGRMAIRVWAESATDLHWALSRSTHYNILKSKGFENDLNYCLRIDHLNTLAGRDHKSGLFIPI